MFIQALFGYAPHVYRYDIIHSGTFRLRKKYNLIMGCDVAI